MFDWSENGLRLLNEINIRIESYGGCKELLKQIEKENPIVEFKSNRWTPKEVKILIDNIGNPGKISLLTGRSYYSAKAKQAKILYNIRRKKFLFS